MMVQILDASGSNWWCSNPCLNQGTLQKSILLTLGVLCWIGYWKWLPNQPFVDFPKITYHAHSSVFLGYYKWQRHPFWCRLKLHDPQSTQSILFPDCFLCMFGTGYDLPWYGLALSLSSKETGSVFQLPSVLLNSSSNSMSNSSKLFLS